MPLTRFAVAKTDSPNFYKPSTRLMVVKPELPNIYKPRTRSKHTPRTFARLQNALQQSKQAIQTSTTFCMLCEFSPPVSVVGRSTNQCHACFNFSSVRFGSPTLHCDSIVISSLHWPSTCFTSIFVKYLNTLI